MAIGALLGLGLSAQAQQVPAGYIEVPGYVEHFSSSSVSSSKLNVPTDPWGWSQRQDVQQSGSTTYKIDYTANASGKEGYAIGTTTSSWLKKNYSTNEVFNLYDYIITPEVKGNINFYIKRYSTTSSYPPKLQLFRMHKQDDGTFTTDTVADRLDSYEIDLKEMLPNTSDWVEQTLNVGSDYCYVGIRMAHLYLDEFSAESALLPIKKELTLGNITAVGGTSVKSNSENKIDVTVQIPVKNTGNVDLTAATAGEDYKISLARNISGNNYDIMATVPLPDLAAGEEKVVEITVNAYPVPADISPNSYGEVRFRVDVMEHFTEKQTVKTGPWLDITPYTSILDIRYDKKSNYNGSVTDTQVDASKYINYGSFKGERSLEFRLRNRGAAPLEFTSIEKPDWVTITGLPTSIAPDSDPVTIGINISGTPGVKEGTVKFNTNGSTMVDQINIKAEVIDEDEFFANFEGENDFGLWYMPNSAAKWQVGDYTSSERDASENYNAIEYGFNNKRIEHTSRLDPEEYIYSPKLSFEDGDQISFLAAKKTNSGSDVKLVVKYSTDRANWEELGTITVTNDNPDLQFSSGTSSNTTSAGQNIMKRFAFDMPAGEYYIGLGGSYVLVDNFHGGKIVPVDYDVVYVSSEVANSVTVNYPLDITAVYKNINTVDLPADVQEVTLYVDNEPVATVDPEAMEAGSSVSYSFTTYLHEPGDHEVYVQLKVGETLLPTPVAIVNAIRESISEGNMIGTPTKVDKENIPLYLYYKNSKSEVIYTQEDLASLKGNSIVKISYPYYKTAADHMIDKVTIWLENTDDEEVGSSFTDPESSENIVKVATIPNYTVSKGGSNSVDDLVDMEFVLNIPFEYDGRNLRVIVEAEGNAYNHTFFAYDDSKVRKARYYNNDTGTTFQNQRLGSGTEWNAGLPVINLYTEKIVDPVVGTVKDEDGNGIEGAVVKAESGEVYYEATTDASGNWSMVIFQNTLSYTVSASAEGYDASAPVALDMTGSNDIVLYPGEAVPAPVESAYPSATKKDNGKYDIVLVWDHPTAASKGLKRYSTSDAGYTYEVHLDQVKHGETAENTYTINDVEAGDHVAEVYTKSATGKLSEALSIPFNSDIATAVANVNVENGEVRYFNLNGIEVKGDRLEPGIYVRVQGTKSDKVRINK